MSSSVHFRFKSAREFETLSFEGDFLKVADLKVAIVERKKLNFGEGFDLEISDASTGDVFNDESSLVQKNTSVIVRRIPGLKQGGILSHQEMAAKNERYAEKQGTKPQQQAGTPAEPNHVLPKTIEGSDEAERIASLVMQSNVQYDQFPPPVRGRYSNRPNGRGRSGSFGAARSSHGQSSFPNAGHSGSAYPDRAPRPSSNYVCHRCNRPGHWIDQCPTNGDPTYDRIKVRAPTGIPRSMLRQVDAPESGTGLQDSSGHFVTLQPNEEEFARQTVGLRLSQAAATVVDRDVEPSAGAKDGEKILKGDENGTSDTGLQQAAQDDVNKNVKAQPTIVAKESIDKSAQDSKERGTEGVMEGAQEGPTNGSSKRDSMGRDLPLGSERQSEPQSRKVTAKPSEGGRPTRQGKSSALPSRMRHPQPPPGVGIPPIPIPAVPPGFPPLGMPPIPPGMPPIPPHILMAMAMANRPNGRPPQIPPGMHPSIPMPFTTSAPSSLDESKQGVMTETQRVSSEEKPLASEVASPDDGDGKRVRGDRKPGVKSQKPRRKWSGDEADAREEERPDQQGVDHLSSELIDSGFNSKPDSHASRALRLDRRHRRALKQRSFYESEDALRSEDRGSREPLSPSRRYSRREANGRSQSPSSLRARSSSEEGSPKRRERRDTAEEAYTPLSPRGRASEKAREDRHTRSRRREEESMRYRSSEYGDGAPHEDSGGEARRGFYSRRRSQSPPMGGRHGMNGIMSPDHHVLRSRSPERRTGYSSPSRRFREHVSRGRHGKESPDRRFRRHSPTERRFRRRSPPRSSRYSSRVREDAHFRQHRLPDSGPSPSIERGRDPFERSSDGHRRRFEPADRTRPKMPNSERGERRPITAPEDVRQYPPESHKATQGVSERSSEDSVGERRPGHGIPRGYRRKRQYGRRDISEQGELKRPRRERIEERKSVHYQDMEDRPSVHDRLGQPVERRRRKAQRKSVHDRLG